MPSDSTLVQVSPFHHLCRRSPAGPRANTSSRDVPPPPATGALESGTSPCSVGYIGSSSSGARTGAKGDQSLPFHFLISSSPEVLRAKLDIQRLPQAAAGGARRKGPIDRHRRFEPADPRGGDAQRADWGPPISFALAEQQLALRPAEKDGEALPAPCRGGREDVLRDCHPRLVVPTFILRGHRGSLACMCNGFDNQCLTHCALTFVSARP